MRLVRYRRRYGAITPYRRRGGYRRRFRGGTLALRRFGRRRRRYGGSKNNVFMKAVGALYVATSKRVYYKYKRLAKSMMVYYVTNVQKAPYGSINWHDRNTKLSLKQMTFKLAAADVFGANRRAYRSNVLTAAASTLALPAPSKATATVNTTTTSHPAITSSSSSSSGLLSNGEKAAAQQEKVAMEVASGDYVGAVSSEFNDASTTAKVFSGLSKIF